MRIDEKTGRCHRLIDEHDVIEVLERVHGLSGAVKSETMQAINGCPEQCMIVNCVDCTNWTASANPDLHGYGYCRVNSGLWRPDEYCSMGVIR